MSLKQPGNKNKIKKDGVPERTGCSSDQHPFFSFRFMTTNKAHSISFLERRTPGDQLKTLQGLYSIMEKISSSPWKDWGALSKSTGYETITYSQLNFSAPEGIHLTGDTKLFVFRFDTFRGCNNGRIIGFKDNPCAAFNIIGYDFDFTAYPHGR
ncbi:hypothetical protein [Oscillibacter sp.]|uniref:hypothetical protein n=1 Tax=Oscillibacter sp. TaxID=1945593 RepID=UPI00289B0033|nr:hypothetical protein [Oscillibacter sp.]